jgi:hypothetical protein
MQDINTAQKSGALTAKEAKKLRKQLAEIARDKKGMKAKNNGKLSADDISDLQKKLDDASSSIKDKKSSK